MQALTFGPPFSGKAAFLGAALALTGVAACGAVPPEMRDAAPGLALTTLDGSARADLQTFRGQPQIVMFWRSDCARCIIELGYVRLLENAATPAALITVALQPAGEARAKAEDLGLHPARSFALAEDPANALARVSQGGRRIPYALALDSQGRVCARHTGMLGAQRIRDWAKQCSA